MYCVGTFGSPQNFAPTLSLRWPQHISGQLRGQVTKNVLFTVHMSHSIVTNQIILNFILIRISAPLVDNATYYIAFEIPFRV